MRRCQRNIGKLESLSLLEELRLVKLESLSLSEELRLVYNWAIVFLKTKVNE